MKINFITRIACVLFAGGLAASCNNCKGKNDTPGSQPKVDAATSSHAAYKAEVPENQAGAVGDAKTSKREMPAASGKTVRPGSKYSAPDGTDAENHDGDQYTKNDTTPMPTGPPIK